MESGSQKKDEALAPAVKQEIRSQAIKASAGFFILLATFAISGWWFFLQKQIPVYLSGVPNGAVMAFDLRSGCPTGWDPFHDAAGRTIVGSALPGVSLANKDETGAVIAIPEFGRSAGRAESILVVDNLPEIVVPLPYRVAIKHLGGGPYEVVQSVGTGGAGTDDRNTSTKAGGKSASFTNSMPYIALAYCKKQDR